MAECVLSDLDDGNPVTFDVDPSVYDDRPATRRGSSHAVLNGERVWQDWGPKDADRRIKLKTEWMESATLASLQSMFAAAATLYKWVDHFGNTYTVIFAELAPTAIRGYDAYEVEMTFEVVQVGVPEGEG
jgi:hypothetical protein